MNRTANVPIATILDPPDSGVRNVANTPGGNADVLGHRQRRGLPSIGSPGRSARAGRSFTSVTEGGSFDVKSGPAFSLNGFFADGATNGKGTGFDLQVEFATKSTSPDTTRFDGIVDALDFDINCVSGCTGFGESAFDAFNVDAANAFYRLDGTQILATQPCPNGPGLCYRIAAHIQGLTGGELGSIWIAGTGPEQVPDPSTLLLLGTGLVSLGAYCRRKFSR